MKKFISIFVLILAIIALTVGLVLAFKTIVNKDNEIIRLSQENLDLKENIESLNSTIENLKNLENNEQSSTSLSPIINSFDQSKIINKEEGTTITQNISDYTGVLSVSVDQNSNSLNINLDSELAKLIYGYSYNEYSHTITGFSQKIIDAQIVILGSNYEGLKVVLLMEDGTIKYINISNILDRSYTVQTLDEDKDFVQIIKVTIADSNNNISYGIVGVKKDGTNKIIEF